MLQILQKQLDESTQCPLCRASMNWIEAEQFDKEMNYHECISCFHKVFQDNKQNCHCDKCTSERKKLMKETMQQEQRKIKQKTQDVFEYDLNHLSFFK